MNVLVVVWSVLTPCRWRMLLFYFGNTRPNKTKAEELIVEVEMEAAVDDEINTLLFEFVEVYGLGAAEVDERVVSLFSRPTPGDIRLHRLAPGNEMIPSKDRLPRYLRCPCTILVLVLECNLSIFAI